MIKESQILKEKKEALTKKIDALRRKIKKQFPGSYKTIVSNEMLLLKEEREVIQNKYKEVKMKEDFTIITIPVDELSIVIKNQEEYVFIREISKKAKLTIPAVLKQISQKETLILPFVNKEKIVLLEPIVGLTFRGKKHSATIRKD